MNLRRVAPLVLLLLAAPALHAGPLGDAMNSLSGTIAGMTRNIATILGPLLTVYGGGRTAWKASHGEAFTAALIQAIVGVALVAALV